MKNFIVLNLMSIEQHKSKNIFSSKMLHEDLLKTARLTSREETSESYQRKFSPSRLKNIAEYINDCINIKSEYSMPIFPTPLVLAINSSDFYSEKLNSVFKNSGSDEKVEEEYERLIKEYFDMFKKRNNVRDKFTEEENILLENKPECALCNGKLYIPLVEKSIFIVDGQHRFEGMKKFYTQFDHSKIKNLFEYFITVLIDYDLYQQSRIFASINFNQKSVNRSLYYDIFGSIFQKKDKVTFAHYLVKNLNETEEFNNIVKMLGSGSGTVSLAFMVETIINNLLVSNSCMYKLYLDYENEKSLVYKKLPEFLENYLLFIKNNFPKYFPKSEIEEIDLSKFDIKKGKHDKIIVKEGKDFLKRKKFSSFKYKHILFKTTGIYGLLLILNDLYILDNELFTKDSECLKKFLDNKFKNIIQRQNTILNNEKYLNTAGKGVQNAFYKALKENLKKD